MAQPNLSQAQMQQLKAAYDANGFDPNAKGWMYEPGASHYSSGDGGDGSLIGTGSGSYVFKDPSKKWYTSYDDQGKYLNEGNGDNKMTAADYIKFAAAVVGAGALSSAVGGAAGAAGGAGGGVAGSVGEGAAVFNAAADSQAASTALGISGADSAAAASVPQWALDGTYTGLGSGTGTTMSEFNAAADSQQYNYDVGNSYGSYANNAPTSGVTLTNGTPAPAGSWLDKLGNVISAAGQILGKGRPTPGGSGQTVAGIDQGIDTINQYGQQGHNTLQPYEGDPAQQRQTVSSYLTAGNDGLNYLRAQTGPLNVAQFYDPSMAFQMEQGQKAIDRSAAARGGLLSGAALKDALGYAQGLASTSYNNAVQQAMANRAQQIGIGQAGINAGQFAMGNGLNAAGADAANLAKTGSNIAQMYQNRGIAQQTDSAAAPSTMDKIANGIKTAGTAVSLGKAIYSIFSDENLKTDIQELDPHEIAASLRMMTPKSYKYSNEAQAKGAPAGTQVGIIAQDAEKGKATRNLVSKDGDGDRMVNIPKSVSFLLAAAAAQNERLDKLEGKK